MNFPSKSSWFYEPPPANTFQFLTSPPFLVCGACPLPRSLSPPPSLPSDAACAPHFVQIPVGSGTDFLGMVDLVTMTAVLYQAGADGLGKMRASAR